MTNTQSPVQHMWNSGDEPNQQEDTAKREETVKIVARWATYVESQNYLRNVYGIGSISFVDNFARKL